MPEIVRSNVYGTPMDLWSLGFPDQIETRDFTPGTFSDVAQLVGVGAGLIELTDLPRDAFADFRIKITRAGMPGTARFRCSDNAGVTWSPEIRTFDNTDPIKLVTARGYLIGMAGIFTGAFDLNDVYGFSTTASVQILDQIIAACDAVDEMIGNPQDGGRYHLPLQSWPKSFTQNVMKIARFELLSARGFDFKGRDKLYRDERDFAVEWMSQIAQYKIHPNIIDSPPRVYTPDVVFGPDKFGIVRTPISLTGEDES